MSGAIHSAAAGWGRLVVATQRAARTSSMPPAINRNVVPSALKDAAAINRT